MTLRAQIHDAVDDITQPVPNLDRQVTAFVFADERGRMALRSRRRRVAWSSPLRGGLVLVAAALVVTLMAALILGGRYWRDLNASPATINQAELQGLEAKPLTFSMLPSGAQCPQTPVNLRAPGEPVGDGPFYFVQGDAEGITRWGSWALVYFRYDATVPGLVLIRAQDLVTGQKVVFAQDPLAPSGVTATGPVLGSDYIFALNATVTMRSEAVTQDPSHTTPIRNTNQAPKLAVLIGLPAGGSGCVGLQIDGPSGMHDQIVLYTPAQWSQ